jgi:hypothetical protein
MTAVGTQDRNRQATEYLQILRSLKSELEVALQAISHNALAYFEESVADQEVLSTRLTMLGAELSFSSKASPTSSQTGIHSDLRCQIAAAAEELQKLNRSYAALLQHSSHSVALMISLVCSFKGHFQGASASRSKYQTWSCQM